MDKLVGLINDYELTLPRNRRVIRNAAAIKTTPEIVISNDYWFVAWLVLNDKIDIHNIPSILIKRGEDSIVPNEPVKLYERLLMMLSIQKNPINYLISVLK